MVGIYLSGTGNTEHCVRRLVKAIDKSAECIPIEAENVIDEIRNNDLIVLGFPTQFSNAPLMVRDFVRNNGLLWENKEVCKKQVETSSFRQFISSSFRQLKTSSFISA